MEIAAAAFNGALHVWEPDGSERPGFPVWPDPANLDSARVDYGFVGSPVLFDLDGDDALEIIAGAMDQRVYVWREDGTPQPGWPVLCRDAGREARIVSSPAIGDLDGDGTIELIVTTGERHGDEGRIYALYPDGDAHVGGAYLPGWPISAWSLMLDYLPFVGEGIVTSPVVADFDGDGADEIALNAGISLPTIWDGDGTVWRIMSPLAGGAFTDTEEFLMGALGGNYAIAAPNANGRLALVTGGVGLMFGLQQIVPGYRIPNDNLLGLWWANTGSRPNAWPRIMEDMQMISGHAVADINGDGLPEIISGSGGHYVHAYNIDGHEPTGWPKFTGGWIAATPAVGDMDGDGYLEVAVGTREGHLFVWNTTGRADGEIQWSSYAHDPRNTGNWATPLPAQNGPRPTRMTTTRTTISMTTPATTTRRRTMTRVMTTPTTMRSRTMISTMIRRCRRPETKARPGRTAVLAVAERNSGEKTMNYAIKSWAIVLLAVFFAASSAWAGAEIGKPAPDFTVKDGAGKDVKLSDFKGKPVLVNIWASWCAPCRTELPKLDALAVELKSKGAVVLAVNIDDDKANADKALRRLAPQGLTVVFDVEKKAPAALGAPAMPTSVIVDKDGVVRHVNEGYDGGDEIKMGDILKSLL
ncbi:MAG: redoxin family protein [Deltaproteobacteria bacterium]|nr:redoxin family protein [Deltaproteobacteria bacterium]